MTKLKGNNERIILLSKELKKKKVVEYDNEKISTRKHMLLMMRHIVKVELKKNIHQTLKSAKSCKVA